MKRFTIKRITVLEIALTAIILSLALTARFFDNFIPNVHPISVTVLLIGIGVLRFFPSTILIFVFITLKYLIFGYKEISILMSIMHILQWISLLFYSFIKLFNSRKKTYIVWSILFIILAMILFLFMMILGDSEYSPNSINFWIRIKMALIYPGDWLNVTITTSIALSLVPSITFIFDKYFKEFFEKKVW